MSAAKVFLRYFISLVFFSLIAAGCASPPKPVIPPLLPAHAVALRADHFAGSPLSGALAQKIDAVRPKDSLSINVSFIAIERIVPGIIDPLAPSARLIIATRGAVPVRPSTCLTRSAGYASGPAVTQLTDAISRGVFDRTTEFAQMTGALPPGVTARFEASDADNARSALPPGAGYRRVAIELHSPTDKGASPNVPIELAVVLEDTAVAESAGSLDSGDDTSSSAGANRLPVLQHEMVLLDAQSVKDPVNLAVILPFRFRDGTNQGVVALIRISKGSASNPAHQIACLAAMTDLQKSYAAVTAHAPMTPDAATLNEALAAMAQPGNRRSAMVFLAGWSGGRFCEDVALSADDATLAELAERIAKAVAAGPPEKSSAAWRIDLAAIQLLAKLQADNKLPPELSVVLSDRAGEAGRHSSAMEEVMRDLHGPDELSQRILAANMLYLEDSSPASRARAYEWLNSRDQAPAGYNPMAPAKDRRASLEKAAASRASTPQAGGAQ